MRQTLKYYGVSLGMVSLLCDNESAIKIAHNPVQHTRTKHIDIRHHFLRDHVANGDIALTHVGTQYQLADIFTKPLDEARFVVLRKELGVLDPKNLDCLTSCIIILLLLHYLAWKCRTCGDIHLVTS
jgi:hypothetical protein